MILIDSIDLDLRTFLGNLLMGFAAVILTPALPHHAPDLAR